ncbi:Phosphonate-transporting ATPase [Desulfurobacterium thermolithotrophum DSM 11699]|uniref:Phosphonate-transporting ATPase n=1 Tax=Desulfurobacterium thermolithotrophum (strain DSM 11699 / BSA) TaxID=868864 RepID=F0S2I1_DESTD|nr:ABC transporter ATP-binding protein [Desulfurobacterium thermolithotrophum]ADY73053.1 Phosphonate-transporting ATPase [Desulfurobacterium thermolithotrophum DSM 11699]
MALIELKNIRKVYKQGELQTEVLKGIDLQIEKGEFVAIMGPSGSGKSTLMYILGCLDKPTSGEYYLNGKNVLELSDDELSKIRGKYIGFIFQAFYLVPYLTVLDNVILPVEYLDPAYKKKLFKNKSPEEKGKEILSKLGMKERIYFKPDQLSGGQKQRTAIARALINSPEVILADEPTGQLDSASGKAVMEIFSNLNKEGKTIIVVTHDPVTASYAKRIIKLEDGKVVQ